MKNVKRSFKVDRASARVQWQWKFYGVAVLPPSRALCLVFMPMQLTAGATEDLMPLAFAQFGSRRRAHCVTSQKWKWK